MARCCCAAALRRACLGACSRCPPRRGATPCRRSIKPYARRRCTGNGGRCPAAWPIRSRIFAWSCSSIAPSCRTRCRSRFGPIRSVAAGYRAAASTRRPCPASCARSWRTASRSSEVAGGGRFAPFLQGREMPAPLQEGQHAEGGQRRQRGRQEKQGPADLRRERASARRKQRARGRGKRGQKRKLRGRVQGVATERGEIGNEEHRPHRAGKVLNDNGDGQRPCA